MSLAHALPLPLLLTLTNPHMNFHRPMSLVCVPYVLLRLLVLCV